jgi:hypothetical protein
MTAWLSSESTVWGSAEAIWAQCISDGEAQLRQLRFTIGQGHIGLTHSLADPLADPLATLLLTYSYQLRT